MSTEAYGREKKAPYSEIDWYEHGHEGGTDGGQAYKTVKFSSPLTLIDEVDTNTTYVGETKPGNATSDALWRIKKISVSGTVTTIAYADGDLLYNNVWADRVSLSYS